MNKLSLALLTLILADCQANPMEDLSKTIRRAERVTLALKVLNYGLCGFIGWNLRSLLPQNNVMNNNLEKIQKTAHEEGKKEGFLQGACNKERISWNYWKRTDYFNHHGFSVEESKKWQPTRDAAGQAYFDCRKQNEELASKI